MATLKVPSLQHLARNWRDTPEKTCEVLVRLASNPPNFSYLQIDGLVTDLLVLKQPLEVVLEAAKRVKRPSVRQNFLELLPLIDDYFRASSSNFVQPVSGRHFPIARGLMVPFNPPLIYGSAGKLCFPWFSYWRSNPLSGKNLSLFITAVDAILKQDPDLEDADFHILDFSAPAAGHPRSLTVIDSSSVERLSPEELQSSLAVFAKGFFMAERKLSSWELTDDIREQKQSRDSDGQVDMFPLDD